ncbi:SMC-Scp complex subunit ScpB [uncultured Lacticaseibacillus sp.]|uniref:SMC-Scp complex subunit ScpB n=1 Tax=uncultured Lacticaseibacillus sp. TaxID=2775882 RepID=UPI002598D15F|nr:SMC-Scp complex subunit ScpB [uncultured Lacticaseibacillus sp.]
MLGTIEAVLYAAGEDGVDLHTLAEILGVSVAATRQQVATLADQMATNDQRGLFIQQSGERFYMLTKPAAAPALKKYFQGPPATGLSKAALESLAIIAYQQPVTRIDIDEVRGVQSSGSLQTLVTRQLVAEAGRKDAPGRPIMYRTTEVFLDYFGLGSLDDLPPLPTSGTPDPETLDLFGRADIDDEGVGDALDTEPTPLTTEPTEDE